jgi:hypothetical protein
MKTERIAGAVLILNSYILLALFSCSDSNPTVFKAGPPRELRYPATSSALVKAVWEGGKFTLFRNGSPFYVKGASTWDTHVAEIPVRGGNTIRTWDTYQNELDQAEAAGIAIILGLETRGIDYEDPVAVAQQLLSLRTLVQTYRNHSSLLCWGIGNEMDLEYPDNDRIWDAVNDISKMIHREDPNHPTMTVIGAVSVEKINLVIGRAPDLDILGINAYADLPGIPSIVRDSAWNGPYIVTEWGSNEWYELIQNAYGVEIEEPDAAKLDDFLSRYASITADAELCLGACAFCWSGHSAGKGPGMHNFFTANDPAAGLAGESLSPVDALERCWTGSWPANRAPITEGISLNGMSDPYDARVGPSAACEAAVRATDLEGDGMRYVWLLVKAFTWQERRTVPDTRDVLYRASTAAPSLDFTAPAEVGSYRLHALALDGQGHSGWASIPFRVQ